MKPKLYRCKFKPGKLPQGWAKKEYNVIDEQNGKVLIGKTWIDKIRIEILETDFGKTKKFLRKISSLTPQDGILIETEEERQAIAPLMPKWANGDSFLDLNMSMPYTVSIGSCGLLALNHFTFENYKVSDFVEVKPNQAECNPKPQPESNLAKIAKWIEANPATTPHDLFVYLVANGLVK